MERVAIVAPLREGTAIRAAELVDAGPPFDLAESGIVRHSVYVSSSEVVFVFEGHQIEWIVDDLVDQPFHYRIARAFDQWWKIVEGQPRIARERFGWERNGTAPVSATMETHPRDRLQTRRRKPSATTSVAAILSSIGAALVAYALIVAMVIDPPALGWLGFAIMSIILLGLGALAPIAFERTRVSAQRPAAAVEGERRLLVIADSQCNEAVLCDEIFARLGRAVAVHLVVPVRVSHLHFLTDDESKEWREAEQSMAISVGLLRQRGVSTTGSVGSDKPLESMTDALGSFPATDVLLATPPEKDAYWLEHGLLSKARALSTVPVSQVVVPATSPSELPAGERVIDIRSKAHLQAGRG